MTDQLTRHDEAAPKIATGSAGVRLQAATKRFGGQAVFEDLDLEIPNGSFTVLVGPSGCGKSTMLRAIAGLEQLDAGAVYLDARDMTAVPARDRGLAMVFQDFALYPHMTVEQNITFGLRLQAKHDRRGGPSKAEIAARAGQTIQLLQLDGLQRRRPAQLSGGQRQRVALARAIIRRPRAFLMDEPLSNLDAKLRGETRAELVRLHRQLATTFIYVTHDQLEALSMATQLVVLDIGRIAQIGSPETVYSEPADVFVARFVGSPPMNLQEVTTRLQVGPTIVDGPGLSGALQRSGLPGRVTLGWRPSHARLEPSSSGLTVTGRIDTVEHLGDDKLVTAVERWSALLPAETSIPAGEPITVHIPAERIHCFDVDTGKRL
jgi:multiple sugar transport system ATP-binding protein